MSDSDVTRQVSVLSRVVGGASGLFIVVIVGLVTVGAYSGDRTPPGHPWAEISLVLLAVNGCLHAAFGGGPSVAARVAQTSLAVAALVSVAFWWRSAF